MPEPRYAGMIRRSLAGIVCALLCVVLVGILLAITQRGVLPGSVAPEEHDRYGAIIDAGSTGSRLTIFRWRAAGEGVPRVRPVISIEDEAIAESKCPLTDFLRDAAKTCGCLRALVTRARDTAASSRGGPELSAIPLWVKATAGVRRQSEADQGKILDAAATCLASSPGYDWSGAEVISGAREGVYAWLAVNHLARRLGEERAEDTHGIVEVGGQSAQIAYRVPGPAAAAPPTGQIVEVPLGSRRLHVYAASDFLGEDAAAEAIGRGKTLPAACRQDGDLPACVRENIQPFLCGTTAKGKDCRGDEAPRTPPDGMHFVGLSVFAHTARNLGVGSASTFEDVRARASRVCGPGADKEGERDELMKLVSRKHRARVCFDAFYTAQLASDGWGVPLHRVSPPDSRWALDASWPLGAMVLEAAKPK